MRRTMRSPMCVLRDYFRRLSAAFGWRYVAAVLLYATPAVLWFGAPCPSWVTLD